MTSIILVNLRSFNVHYVFTAVTMKNTVSWDVAPFNVYCSYINAFKHYVGFEILTVAVMDCNRSIVGSRHFTIKLLGYLLVLQI
jgi:hypothetical protein